MKVYHNSFYAMGSRLNTVFPFYDEEICEKLFCSIYTEVNRIEKKLSYFNPMSEIDQINKTAYKNPYECDEELFNIIETSMNYSEITSGAFDITLRPVIERLVNNKESENESGIFRSCMDKILLDKENHTISLESEKVKIDLGGFGKGYALEIIKPILLESPVENAFISFGESSILVKGKNPGGKNWEIGIKDLYKPEKSVCTFSLFNNSVSSSSNYYVDDSGSVQKKVNVINPYIGMPVDDLGVVSVKSDSPLEAEILSTAFLILDGEQIKSTIKRLDNNKNIEVKKMKYIDNRPVVEYYN